MPILVSGCGGGNGVQDGSGGGVTGRGYDYRIHYTNDATFTAEKSMKVRVWVIGKGGNGGDGQDSASFTSGSSSVSYHGSAGGSGATGALACHTATLAAGDTIKASFTGTRTECEIKGQKVYAENGGNGSNGVTIQSNTRTGGAGGIHGIASGGNVANYPGVDGIKGGDVSGNSSKYGNPTYASGGNAPVLTISKYTSPPQNALAYGGNPGANGGNGYVNLTNDFKTQPVVFGTAGAGGGSPASTYGTGGKGGVGGDGAVIIEVENAKLPYNEFTYFQAFTTTSQWTVPETAYYRIYCIGSCGNGGAGGRGGSGNFGNEYFGEIGGGGAGGNSGGVSCSILYLEKGTVIEITVSDAITSFGDSLSAEAGAKGGDGSAGDSGSSNSKVGMRGKPSDVLPKAYGGNVVNADGFQGGFGYGRNLSTESTGYPATQGGNGGGIAVNGGGGARYPDILPIGKYVMASSKLSPSYGTGGAIGDPGTAGGSYYLFTLPNITLTCGGGGGGNGYGGGIDFGSTGGKAAGPGGNGQPGLIIIEKGAIK